jgi:hypothetical protein
MKIAVVRSLGLVMLVAGSAPVFAHHGTSVTYDTSKTITVEGTVTEWAFTFPHSQIYFDVTGADGKVAKWGTELGPSPTMMRNLKLGWSRESIKPGDKIKLTCNPHRVPGATACLSKEIVINGKLLPLNEAQIKQAGGQ